MKVFITLNNPEIILPNFQRPDMRAVLPEGEWVDDDPQWNRYERDGDIKIHSSPPEVKKNDKKKSE